MIRARDVEEGVIFKVNENYYRRDGAFYFEFLKRCNTWVQVPSIRLKGASCIPHKSGNVYEHLRAESLKSKWEILKNRLEKAKGKNSKDEDQIEEIKTQIRETMEDMIAAIRKDDTVWGNKMQNKEEK